MFSDWKEVVRCKACGQIHCMDWAVFNRGSKFVNLQGYEHCCSADPCSKCGEKLWERKVARVVWKGEKYLFGLFSKKVFQNYHIKNQQSSYVYTKVNPFDMPKEEEEEVEQ
jgi:deoxycytidylate deaminase